MLSFKDWGLRYKLIEPLGAVLVLTLATRLAGDRLELAVADSGGGITPEDMEKIFEPLFSTKSFGVGLGLPMVKQIVEQHGGVVEIKSEAGRGTQVTLSLPLQEAERETL